MAMVAILRRESRPLATNTGACSMSAQRFLPRLVASTTILAALLGASGPAQGSRPSIPTTWAEWVAMDDAVCQARLLSSSADAGAKPQEIQLEVVEVSKGS